jgi:hypothetical protein
MIINFKIHKINRDILKLTLTFTLIKNKKNSEKIQFIISPANP